jgi:lipoic acid synthetase
VFSASPPLAQVLRQGDWASSSPRACVTLINSRTPPALDPAEPLNTAEAVAKWGVGYIVITTVDRYHSSVGQHVLCAVRAVLTPAPLLHRDDLKDFGVNHFAETVQLVKEKTPSILVECLTGDFRGDLSLVEIMANSGLDVFAHNIGTLLPAIRTRPTTYLETRQRRQSP